MSRWYSHSEVLKLKKKYEIENNIKYEYVLIVRFDCIFLLNINFNFDNKYIYMFQLGTRLLLKRKKQVYLIIGLY